VTEVDRICLAALEQPISERAAFVADACRGDEVLRRDVESLLAQALRAEPFMEKPAVAGAGALVGLSGLDIGQDIGAYHIVAKLGTGGMGEVYRAHDTHLGRQVAIKVLPVIFAADPDRLARFEREARILASLNHPHIAAIYGIEADLSNDRVPRRALVMELIEGPTLAERILRGPLSMAEALPVARQIAEALEAAHERGIVHRDLKPANVKIRPDGTVKVLDFGLAKSVARPATATSVRPDSEPSPTFRTDDRHADAIVGTAAYMSPEQARGDAVDNRTDIWAFGCVLYEMVVGRPVFDAPSITETLSEVLKIEPDWQRLPSDTPDGIKRLLRRCLTKDRTRRLADIRDAHFDLDEPASDVLRDARGARWDVSPRWAITAMAAVAVIGVLIWSDSSRQPAAPEPPRSATRFVIPLPDGQQFTDPSGQLVAMSPDGTNVVYVANHRLYLRPMSGLDARAIPGSEGDVSSPMFSPDGRTVAFYSIDEGALKRVDVAGGTPVTIAKMGRPFGLSWSEQDIVVGQNRQGILRVSARGGAPEMLVPLKGEVPSSAQMLPGGRGVLFSVRRPSNAQDHGRVVVQRLDGSERKTLVNGGLDGRYLPTGHLVYAISGDLFAVPFDLASLSVSGEAVAIVEGIRRSTLIASPDLAQFSYSATGSMAFLPGPRVVSDANVDLALFDRQGKPTPLRLPPRPYRSPRASPDGRFVAVDIEDPTGAAVWVYELAGGKSMRQLTFGGKSRHPIWSRDGRWVAFQSDRDGDLGIFRQRADGSGPAERLTEPDGATEYVPQSWSKDGGHLLFSASKDKEWTLWTLSIKDRRAAPFGKVHSLEPAEGAFSPDGHWVAYRSKESEATTGDVFLQPFPATGTKYLVRKGSHVYWSSRGNELFVNAGVGHSVVIPVTTTPHVASFGPERDFPRGLRREGPRPTRLEVDSMPDGEHVIGVLPGGGESLLPQINVVLNWFDEVRQRVPK